MAKPHSDEKIGIQHLRKKGGDGGKEEKQYQHVVKNPQMPTMLRQNNNVIKFLPDSNAGWGKTTKEKKKIPKPRMSAKSHVFDV